MQFKNIMEAFNSLGFISKKPPPKSEPPKPEDAWGGTKAQREKIWRMCAPDKSDAALRAFVKRIVKVDHPRWLTVMLARKVIAALESMAVNYGFDPQTGQRLATAEEA